MHHPDSTPASGERADAPRVTGQTVLVTGGAGFVGSHLAEALVPDNDVRVVDDLSNGRRDHVPADADLYEGDLRGDALDEAMDGVDLVFHQAGLVSVPASVDDPVESESRNVAGTLRVLERARDEHARVVLASSVAVYGDPDEVPVGEDAPKAPTSPYGVDKLAVDNYARVYHDQYGLETVALRYFNVYGPRQGGAYSGVISRFVEQARAGQPITVEGDGSQTRDFVHVSDVVRANLAAATTDNVGRSYNVGTGESTSIRELAGLVRSVTATSSDVVYVDPRSEDIQRSRADLTRARRDLRFEPQVSLAEGLRDLVGTVTTTR